MSMITREQFDKVYQVIELMLQELGHRGYSNGNFKFIPQWYHRKHEFVFGITMQYSHANTKFEDYTCVMFSDGDEGVEDEAFDEMAKDIREFYSKVGSLNKDAILAEEL